MYEKEVVDQEAKIEKMKAEKKDEYDIKKQVCCAYNYVNYLYKVQAGGLASLAPCCTRFRFLPSHSYISAH